jgi:hypothetical protein
MFTACGQTKNKGQYRKSIAMEIQSTNQGTYYSNTDTKKIKVSDAEEKDFTRRCL